MRSIVLLLLVFPLSVSAHAFGFSHETTVNGYQVDIGYSTAAPTPNESVIFDFNLPAVHAEVPYSDVWVRVTKEDGTVVLATGLYNARFGGPRLSYMFPEDGRYTISVRYEQESEVLLETEFPITVVPASSGSIPYTEHIPGLVVGLLLSVGVLTWWQRGKK
ncbi:hypothetical protein K2Y00_03570 [Patescibacteria group bacterium]|nr:hypothetical protein [Patescibacteria group bacterium]